MSADDQLRRDASVLINRLKEPPVSLAHRLLQQRVLVWSLSSYHELPELTVLETVAPLYNERFPLPSS